MIELDWVKAIETGGIAVICIAILIIGFKLFQLIMEQWKNSNEAVNKNTEAFNGLSTVLQQSHERELEFQAHVKEKLDASEAREKETLQKVNEIHNFIK